MIYARKPLEVDAIKLQQSMTVGDKTGQPGDYFVTYPDGSMGIVRGPVFEANFMDAALLRPPAPQNTERTPPPPQLQHTEIETAKFVCVGCGREVEQNQWDGKTAQCVSCLQKNVFCHTCGAEVKQYEIIGTYCRRCLNKPA